MSRTEPWQYDIFQPYSPFFEFSVLGMASYSWPSDFPEGCPPWVAQPANGGYYRIVKSNPPRGEDFVPPYHENRTLAEKRMAAGTENLCYALGLSVFSELTHAIQTAEVWPQIGTMIALVELTQKSGKIVRSPSAYDSHHTWWLPVDCTPAAMATVVHPTGAS